MKNRIYTLMLTLIMGLTFCACGTGAASERDGAENQSMEAEKAASAKESDLAKAKEENKPLSIVTTTFAAYDFARQIAGGDGEVTLLVKPGAETHSFEPTPEDIIGIQNCDLFVYVGGDSDEWVEKILEAVDPSALSTFRLMDQVETVEEELVEGMEAEEEHEEEGHEHGEEGRDGEGHEHKEEELDEHVWTSPVNAMEIVNKMAQEMGRLDPSHAEAFSENAKAYLDQLDDLDQEFRRMIKTAKRNEIVVGDRFPFRYFCKEYGLKYYAAFPGCSTDTQPSAQTVAFLIDRVKKDQIPVVFHIELSNEQMCHSIAEATGARSELLNAVHNVSEENFRNGVTYVSLMQHNLEVLKEALN